MPDWAGPPDNYVPGVVALELLLVKTEQLAVWIADAEVYPTGLVLRVVLNGREPARPGVETGEGSWRFGVQFSDGRKAQTYGLGALARHGTGAVRTAGATAVRLGAAPPEGPVLRARGGGGSRSNWHQDHWLWPLPPPGDLVIACEWSNVGLALTTLTTSADAIRDAAERAQELWPADDPPEWPTAV